MSVRATQVLASVVEEKELKWDEYLYQNYDSETANRIFALAKCESGGNINAKVLDTNGKYSYGLLQFQKATFQKLCQGELTNPIDQIDCAVEILKEPQGWRHWYNCLKRFYEN